MHPAMLVFVSFVAAIAVGVSLLMLPFATVAGRISFIDALFTATSAVCVTGLIVVDTGSYFTVFGQTVVLLLIQLGGLGIMTVSVAIFRLIGRSVSFRQHMAMQDVFAHTPRQDIYQLLKSIFLFTALVEAMGAGLIFGHGSRELSWPMALFTAVFHSVSAFCNAGFSLFANSFIAYRADGLLNGTIGSLIVLGGIGFPVVFDIYDKKIHPRPGRRPRLSVQTKTVLVTTALLVGGGMLIFWTLERNNILQGRSLAESLLISAFQSVTCRTAGFNTVDIAALSEATLAVMLFLMFFGASPGSCGGGVKTTTLALIVSFAWSRLHRRIRVNMFRKSIPTETVVKAVMLILIAAGFISVIFFGLLLSGAPSGGAGAHGRFLPFLFETVSAFGTVGLSMGATATLDLAGKLWIIVMMLIGRVGVLTFSYMIAGLEPTEGIEYAEENIMIG